MSLSTSAAEAKTAEIFEKIRARIAAAMPNLAAELQTEVLSQTPTPEDEYRALMIGEGGAEANVPPLSGYQSADDQEYGKGRVRFAKEPGTFLEELNADPQNVRVTENSVSIGNVTNLLLGTHYTFTDYQNKKGQGGQSVTVGPYFFAFEFGTGNIDGWNDTVEPAGSGYPLRPDDDPKNRPTSLYKPIIGRAMYNTSVLQETARRFINGVLADEGPR